MSIESILFLIYILNYNFVKTLSKHSSVMSTLILFLLTLFNNGFASRNLWKEAVRIVDEKNTHYLELYENYHMTDHCFDANPNIEFDSSSTLEIAPYYLLEFQQLVKNGDCCKRKSFEKCLKLEAIQIRKKDKCPATRNIRCNKNKKYSRLGGYCNNLENPNYGCVNSTYQRILPKSYSDGISEVRKSVTKDELPSAREIGNSLRNTIQSYFSDEIVVVPNLAGLILGQLIAHDIGNMNKYYVEDIGKPNIRCCAEDYSCPLEKKYINPNCIPVSVPKNDPFFAKLGVRCLNYVRMAASLDNDCSISYKQINSISSFLDLSVIYSDNVTHTDLLRAHTGGLFQMGSENYLPLRQDGTFFGGDSRILQSPQLAIQHSIFYRLHNLIATKLSKVNRHWNDDTIFFEARRINIAIYQHIVYYEWIPLYLGNELCESFKLNCANCPGYDKNIDPSTTADFSTNAFRFFHKNIPSTVEFVDADGNFVNKLNISDTLFNFTILPKSYDDLLRGTLQQKIRDKAGHSNELRNKLFPSTYKGQKVGSDLFLFDLMRSRDTGTAPYLQYYDVCFDKTIHNWNDLKPYFESNDFGMLKQIYKDVNDIDLLVGILLEKREKYKIGPIGGCIIAKQFHNLRYGDRFFYAHHNCQSKFTPQQLAEIRKMNYAKLICMVTDLKIVPKHAITIATNSDDYLQCKDIKPFNFRLFNKKAMKFD